MLHLKGIRRIVKSTMYEFYRPTLYLPCKLFNRRFFVHLVWLYHGRYKAFLPWPLLWDTQYDILLKSMFFRLLNLLSILVISLACSFNIFDDNDVCYWKEFWDFMKYFFEGEKFYAVLVQFWVDKDYIWRKLYFTITNSSGTYKNGKYKNLSML